MAAATCQRCGDAVCGERHATHEPSRPRRSHVVDEALLACFNAAHIDAERRGAAEVGIGHLLRAMVRDAGIATAWDSSGIDTGVLARLLDGALDITPGLPDAPPRTSQDVVLLLDLAAQATRLHGATCITASSLVATLLALPAGLSCSSQVSRWFWAARKFPGETAAASVAWTSAASHKESVSATTTTVTDLAWLQARLDRQDEMLGALRHHLSEQQATTVTRIVTPVEAAPQASPVKPDTAEDEVDDTNADTADLDAEAELQGIKRYFLALDDDIVRAPSIGPRTAERLKPHGLTHVKHLLACDPERMSARLGARHLTASRIAAWKNQARLVCTIPWLRGTHAQLFVGAGYSSIEKILSTDRSVVCAAILQFATTRDGQAILRASPPPEIDRVMRWIEYTQQAEPQRADMRAR